MLGTSLGETLTLDALPGIARDTEQRMVVKEHRRPQPGWANKFPSNDWEGCSRAGRNHIVPRGTHFEVGEMQLLRGVSED